MILLFLAIVLFVTGHSLAEQIGNVQGQSKTPRSLKPQLLAARGITFPLWSNSTKVQAEATIEIQLDGLTGTGIVELTHKSTSHECIGAVGTYFTQTETQAPSLSYMPSTVTITSIITLTSATKPSSTLPTQGSISILPTGRNETSTSLVSSQTPADLGLFTGTGSPFSRLPNYFTIMVGVCLQLVIVLFA